MTTIATGFGTQGYITGISQPDSSGAEVYESAALLNLVFDATDASDVLGYKEVEYVVYVTNLGASMTQIDMQFQFSEKASPGATDADWATIQSQAVSAGDATLSDYTMQKDVSGAVVPFAIGVSTPVRGRWMRLKIRCGAGDATGSAVSVNAIRR